NPPDSSPQRHSLPCRQSCGFRRPPLPEMPESRLAANRWETPPLAGKVCPSSPILEVAAPAFSKALPDIVSVQPPPVSPLRSAPPSAACPSASAQSPSRVPAPVTMNQQKGTTQ